VTGYVVIVALGALAVLVLTELVAAALPVVIVIAMVPPEQRDDSPGFSPPATAPGNCAYGQPSGSPSRSGARKRRAPAGDRH
jgi:hypothetical protein